MMVQLMGWQQICGASVDDLASVAQNAISQLTQSAVDQLAMTQNESCCMNVG